MNDKMKKIEMVVSALEDVLGFAPRVEDCECVTDPSQSADTFGHIRVKGTNVELLVDDIAIEIRNGDNNENCVTFKKDRYERYRYLLIHYGVATDSEIELVERLQGKTVEVLEKILYVCTKYSSFQLFLSEGVE